MILMAKLKWLLCANNESINLHLKDEYVVNNKISPVSGVLRVYIECVYVNNSRKHDVLNTLGVDRNLLSVFVVSDKECWNEIFVKFIPSGFFTIL